MTRPVVGGIGSACALLMLFFLTASAPARAEGVLLKFGTTAPPGSHVAKFFDRWSAGVSKVDPGVLRLKIYHNTLGNTRTMYDSIQNGVADIGWFNPGYYAGQFKRLYLSELPRLAPRAEYGSVATWRVFKKGLFGDELDKVVPIAFHTYPPTELHFPRPIKSIDDLKGLKIGTISRGVSKAIDHMGAAPLSVGLYRFYQSLQKKMIGGIAGSWTMFMPFKLYEVTSYHLPLNLGGSTAIVAMNKDAWARLPADAKKILMDQAGERMSRSLGKFWDTVSIRGQQFAMKRPGNHVIQLPGEQLEKLYKMIEPAYDDWRNTTPGSAALITAFRAEYAAVEKAMK